MTNDDIMLMADHTISGSVCLRVTNNEELLMFARAIESRTTLTVAGRWYQEGVKAERQACLKIIDDELEQNSWESSPSEVLNNVATEIRARSKDD